MHEDELIDQAMELLPVIGRRLYASMTSHPMTTGRPVGQIKAMAHLYHRGPSTLSEVARFVGVSLPTASELIDRLVEEALVTREVNPADRRQVLLDLTPRAREFGRQIHVMRRAQIQAAMDRLDPRERQVFVKSLQALADVLGQDSHELPGAAGGVHSHTLEPSATSGS